MTQELVKRGATVAELSRQINFERLRATIAERNYNQAVAERGALQMDLEQKILQLEAKVDELQGELDEYNGGWGVQ